MILSIPKNEKKGILKKKGHENKSTKDQLGNEHIMNKEKKNDDDNEKQGINDKTEIDNKNVSALNLTEKCTKNINDQNKNSKTNKEFDLNEDKRFPNNEDIVSINSADNKVSLDVNYLGAIVNIVMSNFDLETFNKAFESNFADYNYQADIKKTLPYIIINYFMQKININDVKNLIELLKEIINEKNVNNIEGYQSENAEIFKDKNDVIDIRNGKETIIDENVDTSTIFTSDDMNIFVNLIMRNVDLNTFKKAPSNGFAEFFHQVDKTKTLPFVLITSFLQKVDVRDLYKIISILQKRVLFENAIIIEDKNVGSSKNQDE